MGTRVAVLGGWGGASEWGVGDTLGGLYSMGDENFQLDREIPEIEVLKDEAEGSYRSAYGDESAERREGDGGRHGESGGGLGNTAADSESMVAPSLVHEVLLNEDLIGMQIWAQVEEEDLYDQGEIFPAGEKYCLSVRSEPSGTALSSAKFTEELELHVSIQSAGERNSENLHVSVAVISPLVSFAKLQLGILTAASSADRLSHGLIHPDPTYILFPTTFEIRPNQEQSLLSLLTEGNKVTVSLLGMLSMGGTKSSTMEPSVSDLGEESTSVGLEIPDEIMGTSVGSDLIIRGHEEAAAEVSGGKKKDEDLCKEFLKNDIPWNSNESFSQLVLSVVDEEKHEDQLKEKLKAIQEKLGEAKRSFKANLNINDFSPLFPMTREEVSQEIGACLTVTKRLIRNVGIVRWPCRKYRQWQGRIRTISKRRGIGKRASQQLSGPSDRPAAEGESHESGAGALPALETAMRLSLFNDDLERLKSKFIEDIRPSLMP